MIQQEHINPAEFIYQNLFEKGFDEILSNRIALASQRNLIRKINGKLSHSKNHDIHLVPLKNSWTIVLGDGSEILCEQTNYNNALSKARSIGKKRKVKLIMHCSEGWEIDYESFQVNIPNGINP